MNDVENLFSHYSYSTWAPKELQERFPTLESALSQLEASPNLEAAFTVFWKLWETPDPDGTISIVDLRGMEEIFRKDDPKFLSDPVQRQSWERAVVHFEEQDQENRRLTEGRLDQLVRRLTPSVEPDEPVVEGDSWIFAHIAGALVLESERLGAGQTERSWEVGEQALSWLQRPSIEGPTPWYLETEFSLDLATSNRLVKAMLWAKQFHKHSTSRSHQRALENLFEASQLCWDADNELYDCVDCERVDDWIASTAGRMVRLRGNEIITPGPGIEAAGAGFHLVSSLVTAQIAADSFEGLIDQSPDTTDWEGVAQWCRTIQVIWEEPAPNPNVKSKFWPLDETARDFWVMARGLALKKMSPDALVSFMDQKDKSQSESRLRTYFFGELWDRLPDKAREALISADREYERPHGRRAIVFDHLRHAVRAIAAEQLWKPFQGFLQSRKVLHGFYDLAVWISGDEPDLAPMLDHWRSEEFDKFIGQHFAPKDVTTIKSLESALRRLNYLANTESHQHRKGTADFQEDVKREFAKFLGIGQQGVFQKLLSLEPQR